MTALGRLSEIFAERHAVLIQPKMKIRIVLEGQRGEDCVAALCGGEGINENLYFGWSKEFLEAGE